MRHKNIAAALIAGTLSFSGAGTALAEGRTYMDWGPIRTPAQAALDAGKKGDTATYSQKLKEALSTARDLNKVQTDPALEAAISELRKIGDQDPATGTKSLEAFIPTLKDFSGLR